MILRNLLLSGVCALGTTFALAQNQTFPFTLTTADGLPVQTASAAKAFTQWVSPTYTFDEPVSSFRMTVTHTSWQDAFNVNWEGGRGYVFFTMGEFYLYDAAGKQVELTPENFYGNATEAVATGDGSIANLCDGDVSTHYHTSYNACDESNPIGEEHWLEVTFPEPMTSFSFGFHKRSNNANIPNEIIVTKGGEAAVMFPEYGFQLGEKVDVPEPGGMYVLCDNGEAYEDGTVLYVASNGVPGYFSESGQTGYHLRRVPTVDCIYIVIDAGDGKFYLKNWFNGSYVKETTGEQVQATNIDEAAKLHVEDGFLVSDRNTYFSTNSQALFVGYEGGPDGRRHTSFYKASIKSEFVYKEVEAAIANAEAALAANKEAFAGSDNGETAALEAALAAAKAVSADSSCEALLAAATELDAATSKFLQIFLYMAIDEITEILDNEEIAFGTEVGMYPVAQKTILENTLTKLLNDVDNRTFGSFADTKAYVDDIQATIQEFWDSKMLSPTELPIHLIGENGAVLFDKMETGNYIYTSPTIFLAEPIEKFYITFVHTNNGDANGGWPCTNWAHFTLRDAEGETVLLTEENFSTNALEPSADGQGIPGICDYNDDGTPNLKTYMHTLYTERHPETNEHYLCITFPEPMNMFSFDLISRENGRLVPTEMVIDTLPYHYVPNETIELKDQITSLADLDPNKYYILYGNLARLDGGVQVSEGTGYYNILDCSYPDKHLPTGVFRVEPANEEGGYYIHYMVDDVYLGNPTSWQGAFTVESYEKDDAGVWYFEESSNLAGAFKIYTNGTYTGDCKGITFADEPVRYVAQDWGVGSNMGFYCVVPRADEDGTIVEATDPWQFDDTDGESDWFIIETEAPVYNVYVHQINKVDQLNTTNQFALYGNLGKLNSDYGTPGGYYSDVTAIGEEATNYSLFRLEEGANGAYKIHFTERDVYLKAPTAWSGTEVTEKAEEAGEFTIVESSNLAGAFKIYATGTFDKDGTPVTGYCVLQDWGQSMGSFPIASFDEDDPDGEFDWYIYMFGDPMDEELYLKDYVGEYVYKYDYYWDDHHIVEVPFVLEADPDVEDGVVVNNFYNTGCQLKGVFDGVAHTITFAPMQKMDSDEKYTYFYRSVTSEEAPIVFTIDLKNNQIIYHGQGGFIYYNNNFDPSLPEEDFDSENPNANWKYYYWKQLSSTFIELVPVLIGDDWLHVDRAVAGDAEVVSTSFFTVNGQAIASPVQGVNIIRTVLSDGTVKTAKVLIK